MPRKLQRDFQIQMNELIKNYSDCSICGICCKDQVLTINRQDANRISRKLGIERGDFYEEYTHYNDKTKETVMNMPCPFIENNRCKIYDFRPKICENYPLFIMDDGTVIINDIELCAKATHFNESLLDYCRAYHPKFYQEIMKRYESPMGTKAKDPVKNAIYSVNVIANYVQWLTSKDVK